MNRSIISDVIKYYEVIKRTEPTFIQRFLIKVMKCGPIPKHIAFIMDGNRRFAKENLMGHVVEGHKEGFDNMTRVLALCYLFDIKQITLYAFSLENFKRSPDEVDGLMKLAAEKCLMLWKAKELFMEEKVKIRVIGDVKLLPLHIQYLAAKLVLATKDNDKFFINLAIPYTSRAEMTDGVNQLVDSGIPSELVTQRAFELSWWSFDMPPPDIMVRTGHNDQSRLSDFLLWQTGYSFLYFTTTKWPEFNIWDMLSSVFKYQRHYNSLLECSLSNKNFLSLSEGIIKEDEVNIQEAIDKIQDGRIEKLREVVANVKNTKKVASPCY